MRLSIFVLLMSLFHILFSTNVALLNPQNSNQNNVPNFFDCFSTDLSSKYREFKRNNPHPHSTLDGNFRHESGNDGQLFVSYNGTLIAYGKDLDLDSSELTCFKEAYNLKGMKKYLYNLKYIFTLPCLGYVKYVKCMLKVSECFGKCKSRCLTMIRRHTSCISNYFCLDTIFNLVAILIHIIWQIFLFVLRCQIAIFPFQAMTFPFLYYGLLKPYIYGFDCTNFVILPLVLSWLFVMFFPQIKFPFRQGRAVEESTFQILENRFQVKPKKNNMHLISLLIQNKHSGREDFVHTLKFCLGILAGALFYMCFYCPNEVFGENGLSAWQRPVCTLSCKIGRLINS